MKKGEVYRQFRLVDKYRSSEYGTLYYFKHLVSGIKFIKVTDKDTNYEFAVSFITKPDSDKGIAHAVEHLVLNGSKNSGITNGFLYLKHNTNNRYMNATTNYINSIYSFGINSRPDFYNSSEAILDMVFNPLFCKDKSFFDSEVWNQQESGKQAGIVVNEMRGLPNRDEYRRQEKVFKHLFPDNCYRFSYGGDPEQILNLTYEECKAFHKKYYQPENCYIQIFSNSRVKKDLDFLDSYCFKKNIKSSKSDIKIKPQKAIKKIKYLDDSYSTDNNDKLYKYEIAFITDTLDNCKLIKLTSNIFQYKNLLKSELTKRVKTIKKFKVTENCNIQQPIVRFSIETSTKYTKYQIFNSLKKSIKSICDSSINRNLIKNIHNKISFLQKEKALSNSSKGYSLFSNIILYWMFYDKPFAFFENRVSENIDLPELIDHINRSVLCNKNGIVLELYQSEIKNREQPVARNLIRRECLNPNISSSIRLSKQYKKDSTAIIDDSTNYRTVYSNFNIDDLLYLDVNFKISNIPENLLPYIPVVAACLFSNKSDRYNKLKSYSGGIHTHYKAYNYDSVIYKTNVFVISLKLLSSNFIKLANLFPNIINNTVNLSRKLLKEVVEFEYLKSEYYINNDEITTAITRSLSYSSEHNRKYEKISGLSYYFFIKKLYKDIDKNYESVLHSVNRVIEMLFNRENIFFTYVSSPKYNASIKKNLTQLYTHINCKRPFKCKNIRKKSVAKKEILLRKPGMEYFALAGSYKNADIDYSGKLQVFNNIINQDFLYKNLRVKNGVYGCKSIFSRDGIFYIASYRDPDSYKTLQMVKNIPSHIMQSKYSKKEIRDFVLGTINKFNKSFSPAIEGKLLIKDALNRVTPDQIKKEKEEILLFSNKDTARYSSYFESLIPKCSVFLYLGNQREEIKNFDFVHKM